MLFNFKIEPDVAFERIKKQNRNSENAITLEYLQKLNHYSRAWHDQLSKDRTTLHVIDASKSKETVFQEVLDLIDIYEKQFFKKPEN